MKSYCNYCDPKHFTIYGFCKHCRRQCECPRYDPRGTMNASEYVRYKATWDEQREQTKNHEIKQGEK